MLVRIFNSTILYFSRMLIFLDCGMTHLTNAAIREDLKNKGLGDEKVDSFEFGEIKEYYFPSFA